MSTAEGIVRRLNAEYDALRADLLPVTWPSAPTWAASIDEVQTAEGWKLHVSATIHSAADVLAALSGVLRAQHVPFKGVRTISELERLNSGFGSTQIGKAFTVYVPPARDPYELAATLAEATRGMPGPDVPFEPRAVAGSSVFYRYGSFTSDHIRGPRGGRHRDDRRRPCPNWIADPFPPPREAVPRSLRPLRDVEVVECLSQRGKGGVYRVVFRGRPAILKEGRRHGETSPCGIDGYRLITHEQQRLSADRVFTDIGAPAVLAMFRSRRFAYVVEEDLGTVQLGAQPDLPLPDRIRQARDLAGIVRTLHAAGWAWRDLKPTNVIVDHVGRLRPIDFEWASRIDAPAGDPISSPGFARPGTQTDPRLQDSYALGVTVLTLLMSGLLQQISASRAPHTRAVAALRTLAEGAGSPAQEQLAAALRAVLTDLGPEAVDERIAHLERALAIQPAG